MIEAPQRDADLRLRSTAGPLRTRVWWPPSQAPGELPGVLVFFADLDACDGGEAWLRELSTRAGLVIISVPCAPTRAAVRAGSPLDAATALEWAADHAAELEADPQRLIVGGCGTGAALAAAAALQARDDSWPAISGQLLIDLDLEHCDLGVTATPAVNAAPATMVGFGAASADEARYAARLRSAAVPVQELRYDAPHDPAIVDDLSRALADQISPSNRRVR